MNKVAKIVNEIMKEADSFPHIKEKRRMVEEKFSECPICSHEIGEKELFLANPVEDLWQHRSCGGLMHSSMERQQEADDMRRTLMDGGLGTALNVVVNGID